VKPVGLEPREFGDNGALPVRNKPSRDARLPAIAGLALALGSVVTVTAAFLLPDRWGDFAAFFRAAETWRAGQAMTIEGAPNLNPPVALLLFVPFTALPIAAAATLWTAVSVGLLWVLSGVVARTAPMARVDAWLLLFGASATAVAFELGQLTFILAAICTAAWIAERRGRERASGMWLGLLCALKPFYVWFLLWLAWRRAWPSLTAAVVTIAAALFAGWLMVGAAGYAEWIAAIRAVTWQTHVFNSSVWAAGSRLFAPPAMLAVATWTPLGDSRAAAVALSAVLAAFVAVRLWRSRTCGTDHAFALLGLTSMLLSPIGWLHYLPVCAAPLVSSLRRASPRWLWPLGILALFPYPLLPQHHYGRFGTVIVGSCALVFVLGLFAAVSQRGQAEAQVLPKR
jgi:hypothetical protein